MADLKPSKKSETEKNLNEAELLEVDDLMDDGLEDETGLISGEVKEVAGEKNSENKTGMTVKKSQQTQASKKAPADLGEVEALRERLLKNAPREAVMRGELKKVLHEKKVKLEADVRKYERKQDYHLLSEAMKQLRSVVRQLEALAQMSYEALKEMWLKVIHKFA